MGELKYVTFEQSLIGYTTDINRNLWFVGNDICRLLNFDRPNSLMDKHCLGRPRYHIHVDKNNESHYLRLINKYDIFRLTIVANGASESFEAWLIEEIIPFLEKTSTFSGLINPDEELYFSPAGLSSLFAPRMSSKAFNILLTAYGLQTYNGKDYVPTDLGLNYCTIVNVADNNEDGTPNKQVKWFKSVLTFLEDNTEAE